MLKAVKIYDILAPTHAACMWEADLCDRAVLEHHCVCDVSQLCRDQSVQRPEYWRNPQIPHPPHLCTPVSHLTNMLIIILLMPEDTKPLPKIAAPFT